MIFEHVRRPAQVVLAAIAVVSAGTAGFRVAESRGRLFAPRITLVPPSGPVGLRPLVDLRGLRERHEVSVYMCVAAASDLGDCARLGRGTPPATIRANAIPARLPDGTDVVPGTYSVRAGPDLSGAYPEVGVFRVVAFRVGRAERPDPVLAAAAPGDLVIHAAREIARGVPCRPPVFLPDGRLVVGSTVVDPTSGVTVELSLDAAEVAWSPVGDKLAYITSDHKELRLAGPDGSGAVAKVREARGLLSSLTWAPQGDRLAFVAQSDPTTVGGPGPPTVRILDATTGNQSEAGPGMWVSWSRSEEDLLAVEMANGTVQASTPEGARRALTRGRRPSFGPGGVLVVVRADLGGGEHATLVSADGAREATLASDVCAASLSPSGRLLATVSLQRGVLAVRSVSVRGSPSPRA